MGLISNLVVVKKEEGYIENIDDYLKGIDTKLEEFKAKKSEAIEQAKADKTDIKKKTFFKQNLNESDELTTIEKNIIKSKEELKLKITSEGCERKIIGLKPIELEDVLSEILESIENAEYIQKIYKIKNKSCTSAGLNTEQAKIIKACMKQGRELLMAGQNAPLLAKPLNFFYALTAYVYAIIVLNSPTKNKLIDINQSHGMKFNESRNGNSSTNAYVVDFGASQPSGAFSDLVETFSSIEIISKDGFSFTQNNMHTYINFKNTTLKFGLQTLFGLIPEMYDYMDKKFITNLEIEKAKGMTNSFELYVGDGCNAIDNAFLAQIFNVSLDDIKMSDGKSKINIKPDKLEKIRASIYTDIYGKNWCVTKGELNEIILPEICIHFLILNGLSTIMRYKPFEWGNIVNNDNTTASLSLAIRRYFSMIERKLPILIIQYISDYFVYVEE